jgi:hypothetical protein
VKWVSLYLVGYVLFILGVLAALWKLGVLAEVGGTWTAIGVLIAIGLGVMLAVGGSGEKKTIEIDKT